MPIVVTEAQGNGGGGSSKFINLDIPSNIYEVTLVRFEEAEGPSFNDKTKMVPKLWWYFSIQGKEKAVELNCETSMIWSKGGETTKRSKMYDWAEKILGEAPPATFDVENLVGKRCRIVVERKASKHKEGTYYAVVKDVMALPTTTEELPF